jgi:hypothetical protein
LMIKFYEEIAKPEAGFYSFFLEMAIRLTG